ncbi:MAG TPA: 2-oxoacid:acceptor oxidoreductase subunit alpha, partial [Saprospiraceae bacterium]|nr:2-oxoacid:acceptor oxidoreductase subunit alpha [Saprospiraceae bacterium]
MSKVKINDFVIRFANVNGTGSASANDMFSKAVFRMGIPVVAKNIFPSNIQGLPTWFDVRVSADGYLGRREEVDIVVAVNPQSFKKDIAAVRSGGYLIYDSTKPLHPEFHREDIHFIGVPMMQLCMDHYNEPRQQQLFKNMVYIGALIELLDIELEVVQGIIRDQFKKHEKLIEPNFQAIDLGRNYVKAHYEYPLPVCVQRMDKNGDSIMIDGNTATGLGALYGGASVVAWYPITPSTSVAKAFETYAKRYRVDPETGEKRYAIVQAEDELAAIGMVIGAAWNGSRAFTATSGPGVSLMSEFLGLAYYAKTPAVLVNVQRGGPSTGMPTRTQQADLLSSAYASHGDTKHVLLFPANPAECFEMAADALDLADRLQTPILVMTDLDLGMNFHLSPPLKWDDNRKYDRGKVLNAQQLDEIKDFGRYLDVDGDGIPYRTIPGTHPTKGAFTTRGTSRDEYARYTEDAAAYEHSIRRLDKKWKTASTLVPKPEVYRSRGHALGMIWIGTSHHAAMEAIDLLEQQGIAMDGLRVRAFPFNETVEAFLDEHELVFVIEQ